MGIVLELVLTVSIGSALTVLLLVMTVRLFVALRRFTIRKSYTASLSAPSVTICIPARNETHALAECLERVLASDYKKIEIIVFDDNSTDDTSLLVRSFAHAGVRFVPGVSLPAGWLGKNHALSILAREASGSKLVFLDVDTKIAPTSVSQMVSYSLTEQVDMVSVLPLRRDGWSLGVLFTPLRYFWEVILSGRHSPATTSAIWMVDRDILLQEAGNFSRFAGDIRPEQRLAEQLGVERYHFLIGTESLGVYQEKRWSSQLETSRRLMYPMVGMSLVGVMASLSLLLLMGAPLVGFLIGLATHAPLAIVWFGCLFVGFASLYGAYMARIWQRGAWLSALLWQPLLMQEICLMVSSVVGYLTNTVTWKGRPVTAPVIQDDYIVIEK